MPVIHDIMIVSGGQTGADRGGLDAAIVLSIRHSGFCPKGRLAEDGKIPPQYQLHEMLTDRYDLRTKANVLLAHVTLLFANSESLLDSPGSRLTQKFCAEHRRPLRVITGMNANVRETRLWLEKHRPKADTAGASPYRVNVAGNRESKAPGLQGAVRDFLVAVLS